MKTDIARHYSILATLVVLTTGALSLFGGIPYIFTLAGFTVWWFFGHLITADDDVPGGWSNPDGKQPFPWQELLIKGLLFAAMCVLAAIPAVREFGARTT